MRACISTVLSLIQVSFEGDIPVLEYEPNLDDILNDVGEMSSMYSILYMYMYIHECARAACTALK